MGSSSDYVPDAGYSYDPTRDEYHEITPPARLAGRERPFAVWGAERLIVWGGSTDGEPRDDGAAYDPTTDSWQDVLGAPAIAPAPTLLLPSDAPVAVGTESGMLLWWGPDSIWIEQSVEHGGAILDVETGSWEPVTAHDAPVPRYEHTMVWTGSQLLVWGGLVQAGKSGDGGRYDVAGGAWSPISTDGAPAPRDCHAAVWTGTKMLVWGGQREGGVESLNDGGLYDPTTDTWSRVSTAGAPAARFRHALVWTGERAIVLGGLGEGYGAPSGGIYDPATDSWVPVSGVEQLETGGKELLNAYSGVWDGCRVLLPIARCASGDPPCTIELWAYEPPPREK